MNPIHLTNPIPAIRNLIGRPLSRRGFVVIPLALACLALASHARAACQQGCDLVHQNTFLGDDALASNTTGMKNTATGSGALSSNATGNLNTANGYQALTANTTGVANTASGYNALANNTNGTGNTATGANALTSNIAGGNNTATGASALLVNGGSENTATGANTLALNTSGTRNTATGSLALEVNTTGNNNTAAGFQALFHNTTGSNNMANGYVALAFNTTGNYNMANGAAALISNTTGNYNVAEGVNALYNNTTGGGNIGIGTASGSNLTTGNNNIDIGNEGVAGESATIRIGSIQIRTYISGIRNAVVSGGMPVSVSASGQLGVSPSSRRFKQDITDMDKQSEAILALHPVSFHYREQLDPNQTAQFGLIAEEVAKVNPDLVARDEKGEIYSVRYEAVNAMLLNEFLKEHKKVEQQQAQIGELTRALKVQGERHGKQISELTTALKEQAAQIQRVSAQVTVQQSAENQNSVAEIAH